MRNLIIPTSTGRLSCSLNSVYVPRVKQAINEHCSVNKRRIITIYTACGDVIGLCDNEVVIETADKGQQWLNALWVYKIIQVFLNSTLEFSSRSLLSHTTVQQRWAHCSVLCTSSVLSPVVEVFAFPQLLQHPSSELGPVFILELLEAQGQMEFSRLAAQERVVLLLFSDSGGALKTRCVSKHRRLMNLCSVRSDWRAIHSLAQQSYG